jgi:hypothetical protein
VASVRQVTKQIRHLARTATWPRSPNEVILGGSCYVSPGFSDEEALPSRLPFAIFNLADETPDDDDGNLVTQQMFFYIATSVEGHELGENHILGGPSATQPRGGVSRGAGLLDIADALFAEIGQLTGADGTPIEVVPAGAPANSTMSGREVVYRAYRLSVICTRTEEFPAPRRLVATGGSGEVVLTWDLPPSRYDLDSIVVRYAAGATPPADETSGTGVALGSDLATSVTISGLAADDYSVAVFAKYIDDGSSLYSSQDRGSTRASVTVS